MKKFKFSQTTNHLVSSLEKLLGITVGFNVSESDFIFNKVYRVEVTFIDDKLEEHVNVFERSTIGQYDNAMMLLNDDMCKWLLVKSIGVVGNSVPSNGFPFPPELSYLANTIAGKVGSAAPTVNCSFIESPKDIKYTGIVFINDDLVFRVDRTVLVDAPASDRAVAKYMIIRKLSTEMNHYIANR